MGWHRNKVAIIGAGMIPFGELFDKSWEEMLEEAYLNCINSVDKGFDPKDIQAAWFGTFETGLTGQVLSPALELQYLPITRVENACATGIEAIRNACFGLISKAYDLVLVLGVERMKRRI